MTGIRMPAVALKSTLRRCTLGDEMLVFVIDDEEYALREITEVVSEATPEAEIMTFIQYLDCLFS